jgi:toxin ParE1/3/4
MSKCIFSILAKNDLKEINRFIATNNPKAARRLKDQIRQQCNILADFPNMGRKRDELLPTLCSFPVDDYLIFYRPLERGIEILRVVSGYRDLDALFNKDE